MSANAASTRRTFAYGIGLLAALTLATVGLAQLVLEPPTKDLLLLAAFLPLSGGVSLALVLAFPALYRGRVLGGIRGKLLAGVVLSAGLVLINVGFTAYLMFISTHDLLLLSVLFVFSIGMSAFFAYAVAESFPGHAATVTRWRRGSRGRALSTRVEIENDDELGELALAFNSMASELQAAYMSRDDMEEARRQLIGAVSHDLRTPLRDDAGHGRKHQRRCGR